MTGYTVHTGASKKFVNGWDRIFGDGDSIQKPKAAKKKGAAKAKTSERKKVKAKAKK